MENKTNFERYSQFIEGINLADHLSIIGFIITIVGFIVAIAKLRLLAKRAEEIKSKVDETMKHVASIDSVRDLSGLRERMKDLNVRMMTDNSENLLRCIQSIRWDLVALREGCVENEIVHRRGLQGLITRVANIEDQLIESLFSNEDLNSPKRRQMINSVGHCLESLHEVLEKFKRKVVGKNGYE